MEVLQQPQEITVEIKEERDELLDFTTARTHLQRLVNEWSDECNKTLVRRAKRDVRVDVELLRQQKKLDEDETLVPVRVIDTNIQREQPPYVDYLKNSRRLTTFNCLTEPDIDTQEMEIEFTRGMTYVAWEKPHFKNVDGAQTHGWDSVEVVLDDSKPLGVALEHVGHDNLFFPVTSIDIQYSARVIRKYKMTLLQLSKPEFGFDPAQVEKLKASRKSTQKEIETLEVFKHMCKKDSQVYVSWFALTDGVDNWLRAPEVLDLDLVDPLTGQKIPTKMYPYILLPYKESEKPTIVEHEGRCFYDDPKQEAQTAILSGYINGLTRAANLYASPEKEDGTGSKLKEIDGMRLAGGRVMSQPMKWWSPPYPDPSVIKSLQFFDVANAQETNQVNFAATNREDSRKTAEEIKSSNNQQQKLTGVQLTMFSTFIRETYSLVWLIVQSKAIQNKIAFLQVTIQQPIINPLTGQPAIGPDGQPMTETKRVNDLKRLQQIYDVRAAGDVDVIQRQEKINQMMQDWPVIQQTPARDQFLQDLIRLKYPDTGERYVALMAQQPQLDGLKAMVGRLGMIMKGAMEQHPEMMKSLPPEQQGDVMKLVEQAISTVTPPQQ